MKNALEDSLTPPAAKQKKTLEVYSTAADVNISCSLPSITYALSSRGRLVEQIRTKLSEYLVSSYSHVRHELVKRFLSSIITVYEWSADVVLAFLDFLLDETFSKSSLNEAGEDQLKIYPLALINCVKMFKACGSHSPLIQELEQLRFGLPEKSEKN